MTGSFDIADFIEDETLYIGGASAKKQKDVLDDVKRLDSHVRRKLVPEENSECALYLHKSPGEPCASDVALAHMGKIVGNTAVINKKAILAAMKEKTGCNDERCVLSSKIFAQNAGHEMAKAEIATRLKVEGPTSTALLSNFNIDKTLAQWMVAFPDFFAYNFNMLNYEEHGDTLATIDIMDLYNEGYRTFACVINSDVYEGAGKHWMALFGDMRGDGKIPWTVEFF